MASIFDRIKTKAQQAFQAWQSRPSNQIVNTVKNAATDFFKPSPDGVRVRDIVRELPGATAEVGRDFFVRPVSQSLASLGLTAREKLGGPGTTTPEELAQALPNKPVRDFLFGDQLPSSLQEQTRQNSPMVEDLLQQGGFGPDSAGKIAPPLTFVGVAGLTALNAIPDDPTDLARAGSQAFIKKAPKTVDELLSAEKAITNITPEINATLDEARGVQNILSEIPAIPLPRRPKTTMYTTPEGVTLRPNKQPNTVEGLDKLLAQADEALNPSLDNILGGEQKLIAGGDIPLALPQPARSVTIAQLKKQAEAGYNMEGITLNAKNTDEAREGLRLGLKADQINLPEAPVKPTGPTLAFPQEEAALRMPPKGVEQGIPKTGFQKAIDDLARPVKSVIAKAGPSGQRIVKLLDQTNEEAGLIAGGQADEMAKTLEVLTKQEKATFADVVEGRLQPTSEAQANAVATWKKISGDIYNRARTAGLDIGSVEGYFPHHVLQGDKEAIRRAMARTSPRRFGNLELARQTDLAYDKDPSVIMDYIYGANNRIAEAKNFGPSDEVLYNLANNIAKEGGDSAQVVKYLDQVLGKNQAGGLETASRAIRDTQTILKLNPATSITNLTQTLSTMLRTDVGSTAKSIKRAVSDWPTAISNARRAGEIDAEVARALEDFAGSGNTVQRWLRTIGMLGTEKVNRVIAVNAGMEFAAKMAAKAKAGDQAALRELARMGFDNADDVNTLLAGKRISGQTQFSTKEGELPYGWNTWLGKIMTQFKSFAYKQTTLLANEAKRVGAEAKRGNFKPLANALATYGVAAPIVGEVVNDVRSLIYNKKREDTDTMGERYISNILAATSFGLLDSTGGLFGKYGVGGVASAIAGPTASDAYKVADTIAGAASDQKTDKIRAVRNIVKSIPGGVGQWAANTFVPNSYVDNQNIGDLNLGVNEGLGAEDKKTYENLKQTSSTAAEDFKTRKQQKRDAEDKSGGFFSKLFGEKQTLAPLPAGATPAERKEYDTSVKTVFDEGGIAPPEAIKTTFFKGKSAQSKSIEERMAVYKAVDSALTNENYSDEQKQAILAASGASKDEADYYVLASKDQDVRLQELMPQLDNMEESQVVKYLMQHRMAVGGKQLVNNAMVDYLYENDYIDENAKDAIKALKYDEINGKFYFSKSFAKKGESRITLAQAKKIFDFDMPKYEELKGLKTLLQNYKTGSQMNNEGETLISSILNKKATPANTNNKLWFNK